MQVEEIQIVQVTVGGRRKFFEMEGEGVGHLVSSGQGAVNLVLTTVWPIYWLEYQQEVVEVEEEVYLLICHWFLRPFRLPHPLHKLLGHSFEQTRDCLR